MTRVLEDYAVNMGLFGYDCWGPDRTNRIAGLSELRLDRTVAVDWYGWWDLTALDLDNQLIDRGNGWERAPDWWALRGLAVEARA